MRMKTLLLGSAAAFAFAAGSAQAADLSVAEPVDYVRVCDAFGTGYYYIPGTDTCLKLSGYVRFRVQAYSEETEIADDHYGNYKFGTKGRLGVEAQSQTDWGPLIAYLEMEMASDTVSSDPEVVASDMFISIGPVTAGWTKSVFDDGEGGYTLQGVDGGAIGDLTLNQVQLAWAMNGFGIILAAEENTSRPANDWGPDSGGASLAGDMPDLVAAITGEWGDVSAKVAFLYQQNDAGYDSQFSYSGRLEVGNLFGTDDSAMIYGVARTYDGDSVWTVLASYQHMWASNLSSAITYRYDDLTDWGDGTDWLIAFDTVYSPVDNLDLGAQAAYTDSSDSWAFWLEMKRKFGS